MRYLAATLLLCAIVALCGCLSPEQRAATIQDLKLANAAVDAFVPPGERHDALAKRLTAATTVEEAVAVQKAAQAATQPTPTTSQH